MTPTVTLEALETLLKSRFKGVLFKGAHNEDSQACVLELLSVAQGMPWTDSPKTTRCFDLRLINDMPVSNAIRTKHLLPLLAVYAGSMDWPIAKQKAVVTRIVLLTVNRLLAELPSLSKVLKTQCQQATTLLEAAGAAGWAAEAAGWAAGAAGWAAEAAGWAAEAAGWAAGATGGAATENIFTQTCALWMEAAHVS